MDLKKLKRVTIVGKEFAMQYYCWKESMKHYNDSWGYVAFMISNNFYDQSLLNWSHLFGNIKDELHFKNTLTNPDLFKEDLMIKLAMDADQWKAHWQQLKNLRDWRIAHIDKIDSIDVPALDIAYRCVCEYYREAFSYLKEAQPRHYRNNEPLESYMANNAQYYAEEVAKIFGALKPIELGC